MVIHITFNNPSKLLVRIRGYFDEETEIGVINLQRILQVEVTGVFDEPTWDAFFGYYGLDVGDLNLESLFGKMITLTVVASVGEPVWTSATPP